jgi:hypothetical protein
MANTQGDNLAPTPVAEDVTIPSRVDTGEETETDVEILEDGEEGDSEGPVPAVVRGYLI